MYIKRSIDKYLLLKYLLARGCPNLWADLPERVGETCPSMSGIYARA